MSKVNWKAWSLGVLQHIAGAVGSIGVIVGIILLAQQFGVLQ